MLLHQRQLVGRCLVQPSLQHVQFLPRIGHLPVKLALLLLVVFKGAIHFLIELPVVLPCAVPVVVNVGILLLRLDELGRQFLNLTTQLVSLDRRQRRLVLDPIVSVPGR